MNAMCSLAAACSLAFCPNRHPRADGMLEIGIEPFIRIQLGGAVAWQIEDLDFILVLRKPGFDRLAVMNAEVVED